MNFLKDRLSRLLHEKSALMDVVAFQNKYRGVIVDISGGIPSKGAIRRADLALSQEKARHLRYTDYEDCRYMWE